MTTAVRWEWKKYLIGVTVPITADTTLFDLAEAVRQQAQEDMYWQLYGERETLPLHVAERWARQENWWRDNPEWYDDGR